MTDETLHLVDTRSLGKPQAFSGQEQDWARWCFAFEAYAGLLHRDLQHRMEQVEVVEDEPRVASFDAEVRELARVLYAVLVNLCNQGRALNIMMNVENTMGLRPGDVSGDNMSQRFQGGMLIC